MVDMVTIDGADVDFDKPCDIARALRKAELKIAAGGGVVRTRFGEDEVQWSQTNAGRLRDLIADYERRCAASSGTRTRYAKRMRFI